MSGAIDLFNFGGGGYNQFKPLPLTWEYDPKTGNEYSNVPNSTPTATAAQQLEQLDNAQKKRYGI